MLAAENEKNKLEVIRTDIELKKALVECGMHRGLDLRVRSDSSCCSGSAVETLRASLEKKTLEVRSLHLF